MARYGFEKLCSAEQEWKIITTFLDKLEEYDQLHFEDLFSYLSTVSCTAIQNLCNSLTVSQKHDFFKSRPEYFIVQENYISKAMSSHALKVCAHKKFCSSVRYILQCFGSVHYLEIKKVITFVFEDVAHYILKLPPEEEIELMKNIRNVAINDSGFLALTTSRKVGTKRISPEEKCLLTIVYYLGLHGRTHFKKLFEDLESFARKECDLVLGEGSDSNHLTWLEKHEDYFQVHEDNFVSLYEEYSSYKCDYQKLESDQLPSPAEPICYDLKSCHLSQEVQILTSTNEPSAQDIETTDRSICKKFYISATYLTSCFNPLHYLEVKECIFFVMEDVANVLKKLSLSRLKKVFEKVPFTSMDQDGFLIFREDCNYDTSFVTNEEMLNLFVVYYLGFCGKTHFEKVIEELMKRAPEAVCNSIAELSAGDQLKYFKRFPNYFGVSKKGELDVNANFVLPYFEYKNETISDKELPSKEYSVSSDKCRIIKRISSSIAFLLHFFKLKVTCRPLRVILHVLKDAKTYFLNLSALDQIDLIKDVFSPFSVDERDNIFFAERLVIIEHLTKKEKEFLYFVGLISDYGRLHYRQAIDKYIEDTGKIPNNANSDSLRFRFFREAEDIFQIGSDGYITLCPLPRLDLAPSFFSEIVKAMNPKNSLIQCLNFTSNNFAQVNSSVKESLSASLKNSCKVNVPYATDADYKKFCGAVSFLLANFNSVHFSTLRRIICLVLTDVENFLSWLPLEEQDKIFMSIPNTSMDENGYVHLTSSSELHSFVSKNKRQFLFIVCFLAVNGPTHYTKILNELQKHPCPVGKLTPNQCYGFFGRYPKYFTRNSSGYVKLSPSFALSDVNLQDSINFVQSSSNQNTREQTRSLYQKSSSSIQSENTCVNSAHLTNLSCTNQNQSCTIESVEIRDNNFLNSNADNKIQSKPSKPEYPLHKKIQDGISYLLQYFTLKINLKTNFLQVLFLVLDDYDIFHHSSTNDKISILKQSLSTFKVNENGIVISCDIDHKPCLVKQEKEELLISFIVFEQKEMHFLKIFQELHKYNLCLQENVFETSEKFHYFKKRKDIFYIGDDGYVSLLNWPHINLASSTVLGCFPSTDDINLLKSKNNCLADLEKKGSHSDQCSNLPSSSNQSESVCENKNEKEPNNKILGVDETSLSSWNLCRKVTEIQNVDNSLSESEKVENKSNDGHVSNLNIPIINLDSSTALDCFPSVDDINLVKSENNCQTGIIKTMNQNGKCSILSSSTNPLETISENKGENELDENYLKVDKTILQTINTQFDKYSTLPSNVAEVEYVDSSRSENKNVENKFSEVVEATCKFNANNFSPSREWFTVKNDQNEKATNGVKGGNFEKVQLEKTTSFPSAYKTENTCKIIEKNEQVQYKVSENVPSVSKFNPNMFIPSKEWFSSTSELTNTEEACGAKPKNVKKPINHIKYFTFSNTTETEKVIESIENLNCVLSNTLEKDPAFKANLPVSINKFSSADPLTKETSIHKNCDRLHDQNSSSQKNVSETLAILIQSIRLLLKYYDTKVNWALVCGVFQVMNDITSKFFLLSKEDQSNVLKKIFIYFSSFDKQLNDLEQSYLDKCKLTEEQENLLLMTYILSREKKMNYVQLFKEFVALKNNFSCGPTDSDKYQYLMKRNNIFSIEAGFVKLHPFPHLKLKSQVLEADLKVWKDRSKQVSKQQLGIEIKKEVPGDNLQMPSSKTQLKPSKLNHICECKPEVSKNYPPSFCLALESQTAKSWSWPKDVPKIYGELKSCILFLKKSSDIKVDWRIVCAVFQIMNEIRGKFLLLAKDIQTNVLEYIFLDSKKERSNLDEFYLRNYPLNEEQENILLLACILTREEKLHYLKLFEKFETVKKNLPSDILMDSYKYISRRDHLFSMEEGWVQLLPFPNLELKKRVLDVDLRVWRINNCPSRSKISMSDGAELLKNDLPACSTSVKLDLSNLTHIADKLTGPNILSKANQTFSFGSEFIGSRLKTFERTSVKGFSKSCDTNLKNKPQTSISSTQLTTLRFCNKEEKIDESTSNEEEISGVRFQAPSSLTRLESPVLDSSKDNVNRRVLESKSLTSSTELLEVSKYNKSCENTNMQPSVKSNDAVSDVTLDCLDEKVNRSLLLKESDLKNDFQMCSSFTKSKDIKFKSTVKEVSKAEVLNDEKLETENILHTSNSTADCDTSKSSGLKELSEISSTNRKEKVHKNKSQNLTSINDTKICYLEEKSCELSNKNSTEMVFERKPFHDSSFVIESNVQICNIDVSEGIEKQADELSSIENNEKISKNKPEACGSKTKLKLKKVNDEKEKTDKSLFINNKKEAMTDEPQHTTLVTELKSTSLNITEKQISQSVPTNTIETVSEGKSCHETMNPLETEASKFICLEEKDSVIKSSNNIGSGQSKLIQKSSVKIKGTSKDSSPVSKECLDKLCKKMQAGIVHLLKYFRLIAENLLLKVLFHVLGSSKMFIGLPDDEKMDFLQNCFDIFELDKKNGIVMTSLNNETKMVKLKHEEKILLSVTCVLSQWKELHYRKIFQQLQNQVTIPADKEQFNFFRKRTNLFSIANNGYVKLCNFPDIEINSSMFSSFLQTKTNYENVTSNKVVSIQSSVSSVSGSATQKKKSNYSGNETFNSKVSLPTGDKTPSFKPTESHILKDSSAPKLKMLDDMCKKVKDAIHFLLNYFKLVSEPHLVCVILHALNDVRSYFANLNISDQDTFVKESLCSFCTDPNGQISKVFYLSLQFNLGNNDKDLLFLCYILGQVNELHYQEIFDMYAQYQRVKPASVASPLDMHKYFSKMEDLFSMNSDGYVKLNRQFVVGQNSKILSINNISQNSSLLRSPLLNSAVFKDVQITQQAKICDVQLKEVDDNQVQESGLKHSISLELKHKRFKESVTFLNSQCDKIASDCVEVIILHILNDLRDLNQSERERLLSTSDSNNYTLASSKSMLTEEEKDLLVIAYVLIQAGPVHYCKLFELLEKQNRGSLKISTELEQNQYILKQSKYFSVTSQGIVSFNSTSNKEIENYNHFSPASEEYLKISLSKSISTENDSSCDKLIDSLIKDNGVVKNKNKSIRTYRKTSCKPTFNLLEIIAEESSSDSASLHPTKSRAFNFTEFLDAPKTKLEQQSVYFFSALLANVKMANSLEEHLYLASEDVQNHLKECYDNNINHFLEIHQMSASSF